MNRNERADRVRRAIEATISGDTSGVADLFTEDVVAWSPVFSVSSRVELAVELEDQEDGFSQVEVRPGPFVVEGDQVCTEWAATALHADPCGPAVGWADATERRVRLRGATVAEFAGDEIHAIRHYWDEGERRLELGRPSPAEPGRGPPSDLGASPQETSPSLSPSELGRNTDSARDRRGTSP